MDGVGGVLFYSYRGLLLEVAQSLDRLRILNQYIEKQRSYLARIQADIHRLQPLKLRSEEDPLDTLNRILDGTSIADVLEDATENEDMMDLDGERGGRLDVQTLNELAEEVLDDDGEASILDAIDWELFNGHGA